MAEPAYVEPVYGQAVYAVEAPPRDVRVYPRYNYHGSAVYLVEDRWYHRGPRGWVVFREEPQELRRHRETLHSSRRGRVEAPREERRRYYPR